MTTSDRVQQLFGVVREEEPREFLCKCGYFLTPEKNWIAPAQVTSYESITFNEANCLQYLREQWKYGKVIFNEGKE